MRTITIKPALEIENLSFSRGSAQIFKNLNLQIQAGEHVALLGSNGSGKSTLFELIIGMLSSASGSIQLAEPQIAFVPQRSAFNDTLPMTVRDTVEMGRWAKRGSWRKLTKKDHKLVDEKIERMGISDLQKKELAALSGGQRQRTLIAQALVQQAPLLMLDEPEAGLDAEASRVINSALKEEAASGVAVIIATHDLGSAENAERCVLLSRKDLGIAADGSPKDILNDQIIARTFT